MVAGKQGTGTIPSELGNLKNWRYAIFRKLIQSQLVIPYIITVICKCISCIHLMNIPHFLDIFQFAEDNGFQGSIPSELGRLESARGLWLSK